MPASETHKALFMELTMMLSSSAMQHLGKIINPLTGKTELNLEAAQATIDMLDMLQAKTQGNLDRDEERLLKSSISSLQMNYVETAASPAAKAAPAPETGKTAAEPGKPEGAP
jgi:hypothetical protein